MHFNNNINKVLLILYVPVAREKKGQWVSGWMNDDTVKPNRRMIFFFFFFYYYTLKFAETFHQGSRDRQEMI